MEKTGKVVIPALVGIIVVLAAILVAIIAFQANFHPSRLSEGGIDFIKGHMGGNEIILLYGDQISKTMNKEEIISKTVPFLKYPNIHGDQAAVLYKTGEENRVKVKIVDRSMEDYFPMCGGFTQVFGRALIETDLAGNLGIKVNKEGTTEVLLDTDAGVIPLIIKDGKTWAGMGPVNDYYYELGVEPIEVCGVEATKVDYFLVINADEITEVYPFCDLEKMDGKTKEVLIDLQKDWEEKYSPGERNWWAFCVYDLHPEHGGDIRATFPHRIQDDHIEPSCGTGTAAIAVAVAERGELEKLDLIFEEGGSVGIGGPVFAQANMKIEEGRVSELYFSHDFVELLAAGELLRND
jgi:hypothetical protein